MSEKTRPSPEAVVPDLARRDFLKTSAGAAAALIAHGLPVAPGAAPNTSASPQVSRAWSQSKRAPSGMIALPKSGGAVGGVGETFVPNPQTGTEGISVPLPLSKGREGFGPQLSLSYSVANGNGVFGLGWTLNVPDITRKTQGGLPRYGNDNRFLLDGAELRVHTGSPPEPRGDYDVHTYRLRHEGPFSRIEHWVRRPRAPRPAAAAGSFWRVTSGDNITQIFGATVDAAVADRNQADRVFRWALQLTYDGKGNIVHYLYKPEDGAGAPPEERDRAIAQTYLKRIRYGNLAPVVFADPGEASNFLVSGAGAGQCFFEGVFDYGEHGRVESRDSVVAEDIYQERKAWDSRVDAFSTCRPGFEVRTRRTCKRFLMFHRVPGAGPPALVGSLDFVLSRPLDRPFQSVTQLREVIRRGYAPSADTDRWNYSEDYQAGQDRGVKSRSHHIASMPPLVFGYSEFDPPTPAAKRWPVRVDAAPGDGLGIPNVALVDLFHRGLPDVLWTTEEKYFFWKNSGGGTFRPRDQSTPPHGGGIHKTVVLAEDDVGFSEITSDGFPDLLVDAGTDEVGEAGYCVGAPGSTDGGAGRWQDYKPFSPNLPFRVTDPHVRFVDVTGNGRLDALRSNGRSIEFFESVGPGGFVGPKYASTLDGLSRDGLNDPRIHVADMTGDGLADLVLMDGGAIYYWPNLGGGKFGKRITMKGAPILEGFVPERLHFVDIDGSGPADLIYVDSDQVQCWLNISGNAWTRRFVVPDTATSEYGPPQLVDLLGTGISGLLWSGPAGLNADTYLQLSTKKPFLLENVSNGMGRRTEYCYVPSTTFALEAETKNKPWKERLPFPVYVLSKVVRHDDIARSRLVSTFAYAHGAYDSAEQEFRGFGRVEQEDAEYFSAQTPFPPGTEPLARDLHQPPVRTTRWFHTGGHVAGTVSRRYQNEYYAADSMAPRLESSLPAGISDELAREASRSLAGRLIRTEVAAPAGASGTSAPADPYTVTEHSYVVEQLPGGGDSRTMSCRARETEKVQLRYELEAGDPQVTHDFTLRADAYGHVLESASVAYGKRSGGTAEQRQTLATYTVRKYAARTSQPGGFRHGALFDEQTYELLNAPADPAITVTSGRLLEWFHGAARIEFDAQPQPLVDQARLIAHTRHCFWSDDGAVALCDEVGLLALPHHTSQMAFTRGLLENVYGSRVDHALALEGGYQRDAQGAWWAPDGDPQRGSTVFDAQRFYLPVQWNDELGRSARARYDPYGLVPVETTDALQNVTTASIDYRTLLPQEIRDFNGNRTRVMFDAMGRVAGTAVGGKADEKRGDTLVGFRANLDYQTVRAYLDNPLRVGPDILGQATTRVVHDSWRFHRAGGQEGVAAPPAVCTLARETHVPDLAGPDPTAIQHTFVYLDGSGRQLQTKVRAAPARGQGEVRWVGTGATLYDNKGNPIKKYEPFFSGTHQFDSGTILTHGGVAAEFRYDPLGRLIRTGKPDGTFTSVKLTAWQQENSDESDTVLQSRWYSARSSSQNAADLRAAGQSARHASTPTVVHFDSLQRPVLTVSDNGPLGKYSTSTALDIQGNAIRVTDARGNACQISDFDLLGRVLRRRSIDSGERLTLPNASGNPIREWDGVGHIVRRVYDELKRPTDVFARKAGETERLVQRHVYGEAVPDPEARNLRGELYQLRTEATVVTNREFDFKRNVVISSQSAGTDPGAAVFSRITRYDALNRPGRVTHPDGIEVAFSYDEGGGVRRVLVQRSGGSPEPHVSHVEYNARGQRTHLEYGNGVEVDYQYDKDTFRLAHLTSTRRGGSKLQDLSYTYDAAGNVVEVVDDAQQTIFSSNRPIEPRWRYEYDAVYRLTSAEGREHRSAGIDMPVDRGAVPMEVPYPAHPHDGQALTNYQEKYTYDEVGNLRTLWHGNGVGTRELHYTYSPTSSRLVACGRPGRMEAYSHDENGNITQVGDASHMEWDYAGRMHEHRQTGQTRAAYGYDGAGSRVRKTVERDTVTDDRLYVGDFERFERRRNSSLELARNTTHVTVGKFRVSSIESTVEGPNGVSAFRTRFQLHDHLESVRLEVDDGGAIVSYEEYHPFGTSAYRAGRSLTEVSEKRFRYLGKELDEESGLYYFGARYYAPWLGRWTSCDPIGLKDGPNPYAYVGNNPVRFVDRKGLSRDDESMNYKEARAHADQQNKKFRAQEGMKGSEVQSGHTAAPRHAKESGITKAQMDKAPMMQLHSRRGHGLDATVTDPVTGKETGRTRHTAQEGMIEDGAERSRKGNEQLTGERKLTPQGQLDAAREVEWRAQGTGLDQREVREKLASSLIDERAAVQKPGTGKTVVAVGAAVEKAAKETPGTLSRAAAGVAEVVAEKGGKILPVVGAAVGAGLIASELAEGDYAGALVEAAGASEIPIVAQVADIGSLAADIAWVVKEIVDPQRKAEQWVYDRFLK